MRQCISSDNFTLDLIQRLPVNLFHITFSFDVVNYIVRGKDIGVQKARYVFAAKDTHATHLNLNPY